VFASIQAAGLSAKVERIGNVDHAQAMRDMQRARVLLLSVNDTANAKGVLTSKLFEYMSVGRPILAVGPKDGDVARVLKAPHVLVDRGAIDPRNVRTLFDLKDHVRSEALAYSRPAVAQRMVGVLANS
jgi:hypothetical protein